MNLVVGAGLGGLAVSIRLAACGESVTVFEGNSYPGGKATVFDLNGYRFDAGPSLFTLPEQVDALFELADRNPREYFNYSKQSEACRYFWNDGDRFQAVSDPETFAENVSRHFGETSEAVLDYLSQAAVSYKSLGKIFLKKSLHRADTWISKPVLEAIPQVRVSDLWHSMHTQNSKAFENPKVIQLFNRFATYNGSDPYRAPGLMTMIPHLEHGVGTFFPQGGIHAITESLFKLALDLGVRFEFNAPVSKIVCQTDGSVSGLEVQGSLYSGERVISNMDVVPTYRQLLPHIKAPEKTLAQERSTSALIFYWGIRDSFRELGLHNIFFTEDYQAEFRDLFENKRIHEDPTVYIHISNKCKIEDAPSGCENWFVMVNAPHDRETDWDEVVPRIKKQILGKLTRLLERDIASLIECEEILTPLRIEQRTQSFKGALYGAASNNPFAAFLRHPNKARKPDGLFFVGGSVHPGGGIPLVLNSAEITADLIGREKRRA
ncbi:MAG: 1-hydroxycarotenoid 3,4-desaturase CrtD [Verrucomicrobiota bacterium]